MIRALILLLAGAFWLSNNVHAQEQQKPPEKANSSKSLTDYKWDASLDMYHLFWGYANVMLRYAPKKKGAYRFSIGHHSIGNGNHVSYLDSTGQISDKGHFVYKMRNYYMAASVGYEFRKNSGRHQLFYGADINVIFENAGGESPTFYPSRRFDVGLYPFVGLKYRISNRLSISSETYFSLVYNTYRNYDLDYDHIGTRQSFTSYFNPLSAINVTYHF